VAEPEPGPDLIAAAEERGRNEANAAAEARIAAMLNDEQAAARAGLEEARRAWTSEQADRLAARIAGGLDEIERGLGGAITRVLTPFLATAARDRAIAELGSIVSGLLRDGANPVIRISGPEDLLAAVEGRLGDAGATVSFVPGDSAEVEVVADRTLVATRIGAWMDRLWQAEEGTYG
jgi:hypothetical protein